VQHAGKKGRSAARRICIVRGYVSGSGWKKYRQKGSLCGIDLPSGLVESQQLPESIFTPSTKAELGEHDENITFAQAVELCGEALAEEARRGTVDIYKKARGIADAKGIIIADTKFEFRIYEDKLIWIDEALTPDSSRFWPKDQYRPGGPQTSFDKQFCATSSRPWTGGKKAPAPSASGGDRAQDLGKICRSPHTPDGNYAVGPRKNPSICRKAGERSPAFLLPLLIAAPSCGKTSRI
jgi:phosphoribosylaminoimidazole-succinocarboxamide synthase